MPGFTAMGESIFHIGQQVGQVHNHLARVWFPAKCRWCVTLKTDHLPLKCPVLQVEKEQDGLASAAFPPNPFFVTFSAYKCPPPPDSFSSFIITLLQRPHLHLLF